MKYFTLALLLFFLQSCAHLNSLNSGTDRLALLDQYQADQAFGKALQLIAETPKEYPQALEIEKRRKDILDEFLSYERKTISKALTQERSNEWIAAKQTYSDALKKSGPSIILEDAQQAMLRRFQRKMDALAHEELIVTGEWLQKKLPLLQALHKSDPGDLSIQWRYFRAQNNAKEVALQLLQLGDQMLAEKNFAMARRIIPLAAQLNPGAEVDVEMKRLQRQLQARTLKKQKDKKKISWKKDKKHIESFNNAMANGKFIEARRYLSLITPDMQKSMAVELMHERLEKEIDAYVQEELSVGDSFYRAGDYEEALGAWGNIIDLEPENGAVKTKMDRGTVIVEKLNTLRERQTGEPGAQKEISSPPE